MELFKIKIEDEKEDAVFDPYPGIFRHITAVNIIRVCLYPTWNGHYSQ